MDYAFNHRDLRVKEDVSDLEFDLLFWRSTEFITMLKNVIVMKRKADQYSV